MIKILSSRGTGRSYQIARYAISNNCNILVNSYRQINHMRTILKDILSTDGFIIIDESINFAPLINTDVKHVMSGTSKYSLSV